MNEIRLRLQIPAAHPSFAGHFPGQPIVPGVMLLDEVVQAASRHVPGWESATADGCDMPVCKFLAPVLPGAVLNLILSQGSEPGSLLFKLLHADRLVASGHLRAKGTA